MLIVICLAASCYGQNDSDKNQVPSTRVYIKILVPRTAGKKAKNPKVEKWIATGLKSKKITSYREATSWIRLNHKKFVHVLDGTINGQTICPVDGKVERNKGKVTVKLPGWAPFAVEKTGMTLDDEFGNRTIGVVGEGMAYVAILIVPDK